MIEAFIDELDLRQLGFWCRAGGHRPAAYHPAMLLKIYLYGYLNRIQSSRRLEREAQRNVELMWLTGRLGARLQDHCRLPQGQRLAIRAVCGQFVGLCRELKLFTHAVVAIDGSKFKAVNNRDKNFTAAKVTGGWHRSTRASRLPGGARHAPTAKRRCRRAEVGPTEGKIAALKEQMQALKVMETRIQAGPDSAGLADRPRCPFDGDQRQGATVGYNVQIAVDAEHHLIVAHEVINQGSIATSSHRWR